MMLIMICWGLKGDINRCREKTSFFKQVEGYRRRNDNIVEVGTRSKRSKYTS